MKFLEKTLEDIIFESDNDALYKRGLKIKGKKLRQLKIGNYGVADLITCHREYEKTRNIYPYLVVTIYELKRNIIDVNSFLQAVRYARGISRWFIVNKQGLEFQINIVLIGEEISKGSFIYLCDIVSSELFTLTNYTYDFNIDGIKFNEQFGYQLTEEGFNV